MRLRLYKCTETETETEEEVHRDRCQNVDCLPSIQHHSPFLSYKPQLYPSILSPPQGQVKMRTNFHICDGRTWWLEASSGYPIPLAHDEVRMGIQPVSICPETGGKCLSDFRWCDQHPLRGRAERWNLNLWHFWKSVSTNLESSQISWFPVMWNNTFYLAWANLSKVTC